MNLNDQQNYVLVTGRWFRAPGAVRAVASTSRATELPPDFAADSRRQPEGEREGLGARHAAGAGGADRQRASRRRRPSTAPRRSSRRRSTAARPSCEPIPDTTLSYVFNSPTPIIMVSADAWYAVQNGVWFTRDVGAGAMGGRDVGAGGHLLDPAELAAALRHLRADLQRHAAVRRRRLHAGLSRHRGGARRRGRLRHGLHLHGLRRRDRLVSAAGHVRLRGEPYWTPWTGWAMGFGFGMALGVARSATRAVAGATARRPTGACTTRTDRTACLLGPRRRRRVGPGGWAATSGNVYHQWGATGAVTRTSGGYNAWTGNAWSNQVGPLLQLRDRAGSRRASAARCRTCTRATTPTAARRDATTRPPASLRAAARATVGNAYTGTQNTAKWGQVIGSARAVDRVGQL